MAKKYSVESDHKPLEAIFKKSINDCPVRLQSIRLKLQRYDITVKYKSGKGLLLADALSRVYCNYKIDFSKEFDAQVCMIENAFPISLEKKELFKKETESDVEMQLLKKYILKRWPSEKHLVPSEIEQFHQYASELNIISDLVFKNNRLFVQKS